MGIEAKQLELSKDGSRHMFDAKFVQTWVNRQLTADYLDMDKHIAWEQGMELVELNLAGTEDGWAMRLKALRGRKPYVAFLSAGTYSEAIELAGEFAQKGVFEWRPDKWPSKAIQARVALSYSKGGKS